jgi:hypothetical protein
MHGFHGFDTDGEREPVYKNRKRGLHNSPAGANNGALVCFNQLVFREQKDLFSKSLVFFENRSNRISQKTTSVSYHKKYNLSIISQLKKVKKTAKHHLLILHTII